MDFGEAGKSGRGDCLLGCRMPRGGATNKLAGAGAAKSWPTVCCCLDDVAGQYWSRDTGRGLLAGLCWQSSLKHKHAEEKLRMGWIQLGLFQQQASRAKVI